MSLLSAVLQEADKASTEDYTKHRNVVFSKVKELTEKVQMLSWPLQENLIDNYVNFTPTKSLEQLNYKTRRENIFAEYENVNNDVKKSLQDKFGVKDVEFRDSALKLDKSFQLLKDLCQSVEAKRELEKANHEFLRFRYTEAMLAVSELRKSLKQIKFENKAAKALSNIISQAENQYGIYSANVSVEWEDIFSWSEKKGVEHLTYSLSVQQSDPTMIQNVLSTLYATDRMNLELGQFSHFFIEKLLHNIIRYNCDIFTEDVIAPNHTIVFNIKLDLQDPNPSFTTVFSNLMAVFDFLQSTLGTQLDNEKCFIGVLAESIRGKFFNKVIEDCIRNNLPSCDSSYENYKNLAMELDHFNNFLIELKFVSADNSPLNKYVKDTECVLYNKKCDKLLSEVREMLNESLSFGTVAVGTTSQNENDEIDVTDKDAVWDINKPLFLPRCFVSQNVKNILGTIVDHLEESAKLPEKYALQLIAYVRSIAVMYQCVVPKKFKINLEHCPLDIALFFNNCFYLAHGLLGPPWKTILPANLAEHLTTVMMESIQDLRVLGLEKISLYLQTQKNEIMNSVQPDVPTSWSDASFSQFDGAISSALSLLRSLSGWRSQLPARMYTLALSSLAEALCGATVARVLAGGGGAAGEHLVYRIAARVEDMQADIEGLFESPTELASQISSWSKLSALPLALRAQQLELARLWRGGTALADYTCEEVRQIVRVRFPDDRARLNVLVEIQ